MDLGKRCLHAQLPKRVFRALPITTGLLSKCFINRFQNKHSPSISAPSQAVPVFVSAVLESDRQIQKFDGQIPKFVGQVPKSDRQIQKFDRQILKIDC